MRRGQSLDRHLCSTHIGPMPTERTRPKLHERTANARIDPPSRQRRCCAWKGCEEEAAYKAPVGRHALREYIWFCLEHIRAYNERWDYFAGMSTNEIDAHRREDITWHRPTWRLGNATPDEHGYRINDPFGVFGEHGPSSTAHQEPPIDAKTRDMMRLLELESGFSEVELKAQYKVLAKRHHPDLNGGSKQSEDTLKRVNEAYSHLRQQFA